MLLLTTVGRRTGKDRTTPVIFLRDGEQVVLCNVNPGHERTNPWVVNLRANPLAKLQIGGDIDEYRAREATDAEAQALWPRLVEMWSAYQDHYERKEGRIHHGALEILLTSKRSPYLLATPQGR